MFKVDLVELQVTNMMEDPLQVMIRKLTNQVVDINQEHKFINFIKQEQDRGQAIVKGRMVFNE